MHHNYCNWKLVHRLHCRHLRIMTVHPCPTSMLCMNSKLPLNPINFKLIYSYSHSNPHWCFQNTSKHKHNEKRLYPKLGECLPFPERGRPHPLRNHLDKIWCTPRPPHLVHTKFDVRRSTSKSHLDILKLTFHTRLPFKDRAPASVLGVA